MKSLKIYIEDNGDSVALEKTMQSIGMNNQVGYQVYNSKKSTIDAIWQEAALSVVPYFLLFLKAGDQLLLTASTIDQLDQSVDIYYCTAPVKALKYPYVHLDPLRFNTFVKGDQRAPYFLINARCATYTPLLIAHKDWVILAAVMRLLCNRDVYCVTLPENVLSSDSPSVTSSLDTNYLIGNLLPNDLSPFFENEEIYRAVKAERRYIKRILKRCAEQSPLKQLTSLLHWRPFLCNPAKNHWRFFSSQYKDNWNNIPIIINNYNRLTYLQQLIDSLVKRGITNIYIIDNNSTYPPLLDYYKTIPYKIYFLGRNVGYRALWETDVFNDFKNDFYVYTDPDLVLSDTCPYDFMSRLVELHRKYSKIWKIGLALHIDDLPSRFNLRSWVCKWERQFGRVEIEKEVYFASVDTTFALYKPHYIGVIDRALRVGGNYTMYHLPWYADSDNPTEEDKYYLNSCKQSTHWSQES